jgi:hypothetical protein
MNFKRCNVAGALAIFVLAAASAMAEDFWVKKDWKQWSKDDCEKLLQDSPWAKKWGQSHVTDIKMAGVTASDSEGASEKAPEMHYYIQLRSSLPVREAVVRLSQIQNKYDKMAAEQKKDFDARTESLLSRSYDDAILVHVEYGSNVQSFERAMAAYWKNFPADSPPSDLFLMNERGDRLPPAQFSSPQNASYAFDLVFRRLKNGEPVIHDGDKVLSLQFTHPKIGGQVPATGPDRASPSADVFGEERVLVQFKLDKMMINGKASY